MAPKAAAKTAAEQTALATTSGDGAALTVVELPTRDELASLGEVDWGNDGLDEVGSEDVRLSLMVWNIVQIDPATRRETVRKDQFFDVVTEAVQDVLRLILLHLTKGNEWRSYDEATKASTVHCRSYDRVTGTMEDGTERPCDGCPQAQWRKNDKGKNEQLCGPVYTVAALDLDTQQIELMRFKKSSLGAIKGHLNKHHLNRRILKGKPGHYPLFAFAISVHLELDTGGKYAVPVLTKDRICTREEILFASEMAKVYREVMLDKARALVERSDAGSDERTPDTSFDPDKFADDGGGKSGDTTVMPATGTGGRW